MTMLEKAREAVAAYHERRDYPKDAEVVRAGRADYSTDVQCALVVQLIVGGMPPSCAATRAYFIPSEEKSKSVPLGEQ